MWDNPGRVGAAAILAAVALFYFPALGGGYLWDDASYVTDNVALQSIGGIVDLWRIPPTTRQYYPVTFTSFWIEYRLWGDAPLGYHAVNLLLHAINALLVWRLLALLEVPGAFLAALIFAVHPVHVESVAWVAERKNVLSGLFALLSSIAWMRFLDDRRRSSLKWSGFGLALALLAKTQVCALPLIFALLTWWKRPARLRQVTAPLAVFMALSLIAAMITFWCEQNVTESLLPMPALASGQRPFVAGRALCFYAAKLLWPADLGAIYGHWAIDGWTYLLAATAAVAVATLWVSRRRLGKGPFTAVAIFVLCLAPTLGLADFNFMRYSFVADHFAYLASIPMIALGVAAAAPLAGLVSATPLAPIAVVALLLTLLGPLTWRRAVAHRDEETLWRDNLERDPQSGMSQNKLGTVLLARGRLDEAIDSFRAALGLDPLLTEAHHSWGLALQRQGKLDEAIAQYGEGLRSRPGSCALRNSIGVALQAKGEGPAALSSFRDAVRADPGCAAAYNNWGAILFSQGDTAAAIERYKSALQLQPSYAEARDNLGVALLALGRTADAASQFATAAELAPKLYGPRRHWGDALVQLGQDERAVEQYRAAVRLDPARGGAHRALGVALAKLGRFDEAIDELEAAVRLDGAAESRRQLDLVREEAKRGR